MLGLYVIYPAVKFIPTPWNLLGLLLLGFGIWISYAAEAQFHRVKTTVQPYDEPTTLVTDGAFVLSRNPMYLGFASILLGVAILLRSLTPFLVIPVFVALINVKFIRTDNIVYFVFPFLIPFSTARPKSGRFKDYFISIIPHKLHVVCNFRVLTTRKSDICRNMML